MTTAVGTDARAGAAPGEEPRRGAARTARLPRPLAALLVLTAILGVAWSLVTPAFQAPDENSHFGYLQSLAENFRLPGGADRPKFTTEQTLANSASNAEQAAAQDFVPMEWSREAYERWRTTEARLPRSAHGNAGGSNPASSNPPLYYLYEAAAYRAAESGDLFTRLQVSRLASVLWLLVTVVGVWLLAGEVFRRDRMLQLAAAGTAGLLPMVGFVSASLNPDAMLYALWSIALWLGVRILRRGLRPVEIGVFFGVVGVACVVKATSLALIPGALLVLAVAARRRGRYVPAAAAAATGLAVTYGAWFVVSHALHRAAAAQVGQVSSTSTFNLRELLSYLWQFYLPKLPFLSSFRPSETIPVYDVWLKTSWGAFGWLEVKFPGVLYVVLAIVTVAVAVVALMTLWQRRARIDLAVVAFLAVTGAALVAGLHWTEYWWISSGRGPFTTGRYLLPMVGVAGLAVATVVRRLRPAARPAAVVGALSGLFALDLLALALMLERFYA